MVLRLQFAAKAAIDRVVGALLFLLGLPFIVLTAVAVWREDGRPLFYRHRVVGQRGPFDAFKIRSMHVRAAEMLNSNPKLEMEFKKNFKLSNDPRVTRCGRFLRKYNLDELPQLGNVLRGEMSLVGPRPKTAEELLRYGEWQSEVLSMKPGMTGYWQVMARHRVSYEERVRLDLYYIRNWSLWMDLRILFRTAYIVLSGQGD